jgi:hypothetical protein
VVQGQDLVRQAIEAATVEPDVAGRLDQQGEGALRRVQRRRRPI